MQHTAHDFLEEYFGTEDFQIEMLPKSGSARSNFIVHSNADRFILTVNGNLRENEAFLYFTGLFEEYNLNVPKVFAVSRDREMYLQEYLGTHTFSQIIAEEGHSPRVKELFLKSIDLLYRFQTCTEGVIDYSRTFEYEQYDELPIIHDLYYFKNFLADVLELPYHKSSLLIEFHQIAETVKNLKPRSLMIRDFQARNIMIDGDRISFIDYQSAMAGPAVYDLVSFIYQAKAAFPADWKKEAEDRFSGFYSEQISRTDFDTAVDYCKLMRYLQVLGAYGFRGLVQHKTHFLDSLPRGIENIHLFAEEWQEMHKYPELQGLIRQLADFDLNSAIGEINN
ncbi:MAG: aminoglycoside phosphotransferase [Chryseobacterium sp.]|nr:MAG: aminoglycoside phosphotransferase [Chryseobacterium sp.]